MAGIEGLSRLGTAVPFCLSCAITDMKVDPLPKVSHYAVGALHASGGT